MLCYLHAFQFIPVVRKLHVSFPLYSVISMFMSIQFFLVLLRYINYKSNKHSLDKHDGYISIIVALSLLNTFVVNSVMQGLCGTRRLAVQEGLALFLSETIRQNLFEVFVECLVYCPLLVKKILTLSILFQEAQSAINDLTGTSRSHLQRTHNYLL